MTFRVIARRIGDSWDDPESWELAPYNDGKGGEYKNLSKVSAEDVEGKTDLIEHYASEFIDYLGMLVNYPEATATFYLVSLDGDGLPDSCAALTPAVALSVRGDDKAFRIVPEGDRAARRDRDTGLRISIDKPTWVARLRDKSDFLALGSLSTEVVWICDGGYNGWRALMEARDQKQIAIKIHADRVKAQELIQSKHDSGDFFINPYTFVPLPEQIERSSPRGHSELANDGLSGSFDWVLTLQTPLLLPSDDSDTTTGSILHYPGSSLRGALRSLHESLAGGCMRALEDDYVPVHRETMNALQSGDRLVVVREIDPATDRVVSVEETNSITWVRLNALHGLLPLHSGQTLDIDPAGRNLIQVKSRHEVHDPAYVSKGSGWVLHLSDQPALEISTTITCLSED